MMKVGRYLFVVFASGIFIISVSAVGAQQRFPATAPQSAISGKEGGKAGILDKSSPPIISDDMLPKPEGIERQTSDTSIEAGDIFQPRPGTGTRGAVFQDTEESGPYRAVPK